MGIHGRGETSFVTASRSLVQNSPVGSACALILPTPAKTWLWVRVQPLPPWLRLWKILRGEKKQQKKGQGLHRNSGLRGTTHSGYTQIFLLPSRHRLSGVSLSRLLCLRLTLFSVWRQLRTQYCIFHGFFCSLSHLCAHLWRVPHTGVLPFLGQTRLWNYQIGQTIMPYLVVRTRLYQVHL